MTDSNHQPMLTKEQIDSVVSLYYSGKFNDAIDAINLLNVEYPNVPLLYNILGVCYKSLGKFRDSVKAFEKAINNSNKVAMSLSDLFCVERHKLNFLDLVKNKLDITFANEQEFISLINAKSFNDVITFAKQINKLVVITRGENGAIAIDGNEVAECGVMKDLKIVDLTGAGDLFAGGYLHGYLNNFSAKDCLEKGTEMSSKIIQQFGARI